MRLSSRSASPGAWSPQRAPRPAVVALATCLLLASGCQYSEDVLSDRVETFDPRSIFTDLGSSPAPGSASPGAAAGSRWSGDPCGRPSGTPEEELYLVDLFAAAEPQSFWRLVQDSQEAVLVLSETEEADPTAFLFVEKAVSGSRGLGRSLRKFQRRFDQRLQQDRPARKATNSDGEGTAEGPSTEPASVPGAGDLVNPAAPAVGAGEAPTGAGPVPSGSAPDAASLSGAAEPGAVDAPGEREPDEDEPIFPFGFESEPGGFSGWKWIGHCGVPTEDDDPTATVPDPVSPDPEPGEEMDEDLRPFFRLSRIEGRWRHASDDAPAPAIMILGTATLPERPDYGVHLAIVCKTVPRCEAGPDLARFLGSLRASSGRARASAEDAAPDALERLARELGVKMERSSP